MKRFLFFITILLIPLFSFSQLSGTYSFPINKVGSCFLTLFDDGEYSIKLVYSDKSYTIGVSVGKFAINKNTLILTDKYNNYTLVFESKKDIILDSNYLITKHGFVWMKNAKLYKNLDQESEPSNTLLSSKTLEQERLTNKQNNRTLYPLRSGFYKSCQWGWCFSLELSKTDRYIYSFESIILSEGTYLRNKNELILFDDSLEHPFYFFINQKSIQEKFIPYDGNFNFYYISCSP